MYVYKLPNGHELCRSESEVTFNETELPVFAKIKPEIIKQKKKTTSDEKSEKVKTNKEA